MATISRRAALATAAALCGWPRREPPPPQAGRDFLLPAPPADEPPATGGGFIDHDPPLPYVHCPSLCTGPDGRLHCTWYAGSREGGRDVAVWIADAEMPPDGLAAVWGPPRVVADRTTAIADLDRYVAKVGNPVVFATADRLWVVFVTIAVGGWSGSSLNAVSSTDGGRTWSPARRLVLSPFFNISELVRAAPVPLEGGGVGLPVYHEFAGKFPEMLWLEPRGDRLVATKSRLAGGRSLLQPAVVPADARRAVAYLRNHGPDHALVVQRTNDGGRSWSPPAPTSLPNPDASVAALRLATGAVIVACNLSPTDRHDMTLVRSPDGVGDWSTVAVLENEPRERFAYPFLSRDPGGRIHLVYTWKMRRIRHHVFTERWLLETEASA